MDDDGQIKNAVALGWRQKKLQKKKDRRRKFIVKEEEKKGLNGFVFREEEDVIL